MRGDARRWEPIAYERKKRQIGRGKQRQKEGGTLMRTFIMVFSVLIRGRIMAAKETVSKRLNHDFPS
jgi:hypothetical protein